MKPHRLTCLALLFLAVTSLLFAAKPLEIENIRYSSYGNDLLIRTQPQINTPVDKALISIDPPAPFRVHQWGNPELSIEAEPGKVYQVILKKGFPNANAPAQLQEDYRYIFITPDLRPNVNFASEGTFFPLHAPIWELPVSTVNIGKKLDYRLKQAYPSTLLNFFRDHDRFSREIQHGTVKIQERRNQEHHTAIDLADIGIPRGKPGVYFLKMSYDSGDYYYQRERQRTIIITDLAIFLARNGAESICTVRSLAHPEKPVPGAKVTLFSRKHQILATATTGPDGIARFTTPSLSDQEDAPDLLLVQNPADNDLAFLDLPNWSRASQNAASSWNALLYTDRGAARPGETMTATAFLRRMDTSAPVAGVPLQLALHDPKYNVIARADVKTDEFGAFQHDFHIPADAILGSYRIAVSQPGGSSFATSEFLVAEFQPDQIKAKATLKAAKDGKAVQLTGKAEYYFGQPVSKAKVKARLLGEWKPFTPPAAYKEFSFKVSVQEDFPFPPRTATPQTDQDGAFQCDFKLPDFQASPKKYPACPILLCASATIQGLAGTRPVTANTFLLRHFAPFYLGVRLDNQDSKSARFQLAALAPDGKPFPLQPGAITASLVQVDYAYVLKASGDGTYRRVWEVVTNTVSRGAVTPDDKGFLQLDVPQNGSYRVEFTDTANGRLLAQFRFWHYAGSSGARSAHPNVLEFKFNADKFRPGETAQVSYEADFDGTCLAVTGSYGQPSATATYPVKAGKNTIPVQIPASCTQGTWFAAITVVGAVSQGADGTCSDAPHLAGVAAIPVHQEGRRLQVTITPASEVCRPDHETTVTVTLADANGKPVAGEVALWGVDEGILALTAYRTPDAFKAFFGPRESPFELFDLYAEIYPMLRVVNGKIGGGDAVSAAKAREFREDRFGNERPPEGVVRCGLLRTGPDGKATAKVKLPPVSGSLRLMAVAADADCAGHGQASITLREPLTISLVTPAAVAPGDKFRVSAAIFNHDLPDTAVQNWQWKLEGVFDKTPKYLAEPIALGKPGTQQTRFIEIELPENTKEGRLVIHFEVAVDGQTYRKRDATIVRSPWPAVPVSEVTIIAPGEKATFTQGDAPSDVLELGSPVLRLSRHLAWLNEYPHGCLEQTVSRAFPQLAIPALVRSGYIPSAFAPQARMKINAAMRHIATMRYGKSFSMWPNGHAPWQSATVFAYFFMLEADRNGYPMADEDRGRAFGMLREFLNDRSNSVAERAFATYAFALGWPQLAADYVKLLDADSPKAQPYVRFLAAMTLLRCGHAAEGNALWKPIAGTAFAAADLKDCEFDSSVRRTGLALWLLSDLLPGHLAADHLAIDLARLDDATHGWMTTHDHAWAALGLAQYAATRPGNARQDKLTAAIATKAADGKRLESRFTPGDKPFEYHQPGETVITNDGTAPLYVVHRQRRRERPTRPVASGLAVRREYLLGGKPVTTCRVGDLLEVRLILNGTPTENLVLSDLLPGGFEIEDPNFATRFTIPQNRRAEHNRLYTNLIERRPDRFLWFGDMARGAERATITYHVRAIAPGVYTIPVAQLEAMYNPRLRAITFSATPVFTILP